MKLYPIIFEIENEVGRKTIIEFVKNATSHRKRRVELDRARRHVTDLHYRGAAFKVKDVYVPEAIELPTNTSGMLTLAELVNDVVNFGSGEFDRFVEEQEY